MKDFNFKTGAVMSTLAVLLTVAIAGNGCGTGNDTATGGAGTSGGAGTGSSTGAAGTGSSTGAAGTGSSTGAAGTGNGTGAAGTGSSTGAAGTGSLTTLPETNGVCKGEGTRDLTVAEGKIDNFEDAAISPGWSTFNDVEVGGMKNTIKLTQEAGGAAGSAHAARYAGMGAKTPTNGGYGVGALYNAAIDKTSNIYCVSVIAFDGLTFWAKAAKAGAKIGVNFVVPETNMAPDGDCTTGCFNHPQKSVTLTTEWAQYTVPFSQAVAGKNKINGRVQMVGFLAPDADWDFTVDEIQFYKGTPPTTAIPTN
jgi:hypothetical protein